MAEVPVSADFAPPTCACPACGSECKRHSTYTRKVKDISLDGPVVQAVRVGNYFCRDCGRFFKPEVPFAHKSKRYTTRAVAKATAAVQEDKTTYTALPRRMERDFNIRPSKSTVWKWFQDHAGSIEIDEYLTWASGRFSGQLSVDSIDDGGVQMWFATDPLNRDLILGYRRSDSADKASLRAFLTDLRDKFGLKPDLFISDDANVFDTVPEEIWKGVPVQLCHFHVLKNLGYRYLRHSLKERLLACKPEGPGAGRPPTTLDGAQRLKERQAERKKQWTELFRKRRLFFKSERSLAKPDSVERGEAAYVEEACREFPKLATFRAFVLDFYAIMSSKDAASANLLRRAFLARWAEEDGKDERIAHVLGRFADDRWFGKLFQFTAFEDAHRTTNSTERANRWFRKRQKTHYRNRKERTIKNMLHADLICRRDRTPGNEPPHRLRWRPIDLTQAG